ncbi:coiled-coil domain-containing protein 191 [Zootermopsis nevadensis]|uniref:Coiled-coil domain-containing protein n=1 Tax=Zootermopsis nevadensis TaxID=136037 RepID=A0A067RK11_ZOONE|nr:coiled-coil domain-containing protein 191 [Zootermopsis nevadensis]XP_021917432.1 coiled-coil domain-containing protein 191 [Zootermopsis nevadensis]XP_021917440.1 coiled-coil domain-containing protein 191 [Zootermopsis nevadensis]KDR24176.1 Coiled-coil domain-containing protein [Zootermopsis nevadensis]
MKLSDQFKGCHLTDDERKRLTKNKSISVTDVKNVVTSSCDMSNRKLFLNMNVHNPAYEISHNPILDIFMTDTFHNNEETKAVTNIDLATNYGVVKGIVSEYTENSMKLHCNEGFVFNREDLVSSVWKKWKVFTINKKMNKAKDQTYEIKKECKKEKTQINKKILRKYWDIWLCMVKQKKRTLSTDHDKLQREEKINKFLKVLKEQKQSLASTKAPAMTKNLGNIKNETSRNSKYSYHNKQNVQNNVGFQTKTFPMHKCNEYQQSLEVHLKIIAEQKSKLEEQSKLIKELQLAHFRLQTEKSTKETQEEINHTLSSCDLRLKPKAKQVKSRLSTEYKPTQLPENKLAVVSLHTVPTILNRMEERARDRESRWKLIRERKQNLAEVKQKKERDEKKKKEEYEKWQKIEELKENRRLEKQMEIKKKRDREKMHNLMIMASLQYKKLLMKKVMFSFKQVVALNRKLMDIAKKYYKNHLLRNYFQTWREHTQSAINLKMCKATACYNTVLVKKAFRGLFQVYSESVTKNQVATDFYDLRLQEHSFIGWHHIACTEHVITVNKQELAAVHYNRKLLTRCFKRWQQLPSMMELEREKEQRKEIWRKKVQEFLPDFKPLLVLD